MLYKYEGLGLDPRDPDKKPGLPVRSPAMPVLGVKVEAKTEGWTDGLPAWPETSKLQVWWETLFKGVDR